jgi:hypothetical protein
MTMERHPFCCLRSNLCDVNDTVRETVGERDGNEKSIILVNDEAFAINLFRNYLRNCYSIESLLREREREKFMRSIFLLPFIGLI